MTPKQVMPRGAQAQMMESNTDILNQVKSTLDAAGEISVSNVAGIISPELARKLQDPSQQKALLSQLYEAYPEYLFTGLDIIDPKHSGDGNYHIQVGMSKFAHSTNSEAIEDAHSTLIFFGDKLNSINMPVTRQLYQNLKDSKKQEAFIREFEKKNPGYTCAITTVPPFQAGGGNYQIKLRIKKTVTAVKLMESNKDILNDVGSLVRSFSNVNIAGTAMVISRELGRKLQDPLQRQALLRQLREVYPTYDFTNLNILNPGQVGDTNYHLQIRMKRR